MNDLAELKVQIDDHVAVLTVDSPPVNALTRVLNDELTLALDRISEMDEIRVVVLTGAGKVFCAGDHRLAGERNPDFGAGCVRGAVVDPERQGSR